MEFQIKTYQFTSNKITESGEQLSFVLLSDLHLKEFGEKNRDLISAIAKLGPDAVLVTGDMFTGRYDCNITVAEELMVSLGERYPVFYVNGNHEQRMKNYRSHYGDRYKFYQRKLKKAGVVFLENTHADFRVRNIPLHICGLELPLRYYEKFKRISLPEKEVTQRVGMAKDDAYNILLAHHPRFAEAYFAWGADLILSGHLHGGVCRLGGHAVVSPDGRIFPRFGYGLFQRKNQNMVVSAGLGEHTLPFRIFNPRELVHIIIREEESHGDTC